MKSHVRFHVAVLQIALLTGALTVFQCCDDKETDDPTGKEINDLRQAMQPYHAIDNAILDGYDNEFTGYRSQMGFHYLNEGLLDDVFELTKPEVLMFAPDETGQLQFVGVEYAVPITDMNNPPPAPEGFTGDQDEWAINNEFNVWTLHVWVGLENPHGVFAQHNPNLP